ncbi:hypothetical protein ACLOJK_033707 [Asimina triloba]
MEEASLPRVAAAGRGGLRPHRIRDELDVTGMMSGLDSPTEYSPLVGFNDNNNGVVARAVVARGATTSFQGDPIHRSDPALKVTTAINVDGGASYVYRIRRDDLDTARPSFEAMKRLNSQPEWQQREHGIRYIEPSQDKWPPF